MRLKQTLTFISCLFLCLSGTAQGRPTTSEKIAYLTQQHDLQLVEVNLTGEQFNKNIHKVNISILDRPAYDYMVLLDETGDFYIKKGNYQLNIWLDTIRPIAYTHRFSVDTLPLCFSYEIDSLMSNFDFSTSWLDFPTEKDTLHIWQSNDNNWMIFHDSLEVVTIAGAKKMTWHSHRKGGRMDTIYHQSLSLDHQLIEGFHVIESLLQYPKGIRHTKFESCENCRGNQSIIKLRYRDYELYFWEPKCRNGYWRKYRNLFFGWEN